MEQRGQDSGMDEQKTPVKSEAQAGDTQEVKAATGHFEQIKRCCPDGMLHSQVLRELADTTAGLLEVVLERHGDQERCLRTGRK